ncbi:CocE/NonD family hydrolase [Paenibacillus uliginis]|uniref:CocE/NonD family hydrolase n=1 Tax=Paenibacillus uliginis TaxID=683737 RepID=UPI001AD8397C
MKTTIAYGKLLIPTDWVPHGYVVVRVDSRGSGSSPGKLDPLCPREIKDYAACIEWAGVQCWCFTLSHGLTYYFNNDARFISRI